MIAPEFRDHADRIAYSIGFLMGCLNNQGAIAHLGEMDIPPTLIEDCKRCLLMIADQMKMKGY